MDKRLLSFALLLLFFCPFQKIWGQTNQTVTNGQSTTAVSFPGGGCIYNWTNSNPSIGLPASGTGDIASFTAVNNGSSVVSATITATPVASGFAYISDYQNGVSVISTVSNNIVANIQTGLTPYGVAITPDGSRVYVTNVTLNVVSVIDAGTEEKIATIPLGFTPRDIFADPDGSKVFVPGPDGIYVIDAKTNVITGKISIAAAYSLCFSQDATKMYVIDNYRIDEIDLSTNTIINSISDFNLKKLLKSPDGTKLYASYSDTYYDSVLVIDLASFKITSTFDLPEYDYAEAISNDGTKLYLDAANAILVLDIATNSIVGKIPLTASPLAFSLNSDGSRLYVACNNPEELLVINTATNEIIATVTNLGQVVSTGHFVTDGKGCNGTPIKFTITVGPTLQALNVSAVRGMNYSCVGSVSLSPRIQQFTISTAALSGDVVVTAPAGFELSPSRDAGYDKIITIPKTGNIFSSVIIYARLDATNIAGDVSGTVVLKSAGIPDQSVVVGGTVTALPVTDPVSNQTVNNGELTTPINFTGGGNTFTWVNNMPGVGLPETGTGNIGAFNAVNTGKKPLTATITVTPSTAGVVFVSAGSNPGFAWGVNATNYKVVQMFNLFLYSGVIFEVSPDWNYVYTISGSNINIISPTSLSFIGGISLNQVTSSISVSPDGKLIYAAIPSQNVVMVIDAMKHVVVSQIPIDGSPQVIKISPDGQRLYVLTNDKKTFLVINTANNALEKTIYLTNYSEYYTLNTYYQIIATSDGNNVYITNGGFLIKISTATNTIVKTLDEGAFFMALAPDDSRLYVASGPQNEGPTALVHVLNTETDEEVAKIIVPGSADGICLSPDGSKVYVTNGNSNAINGGFYEGFSIFDASTNVKIKSVEIGYDIESYGNFVTGNDCSGTPTTFTITVNPAKAPAFTVAPVTGTISACVGSASTSPDIQQLTVSGNNLTGDITAIAPANFEISLVANGGYSNSIVIPQTNGTVNNTTTYVRSAANAPVGNISGNVVLSSTGATNQDVSVTGVVNAIPIVNQPISAAYTSGQTASVNFAGTADTYTWVNDQPGIGLAANGTGSIGIFTTVNAGNTPVVAKIKVTPSNSTGCDGSTQTFTITVNPVPSAIVADGHLSALNTVYGTPSSPEFFTVSGTNLNSGVSITAPAGFQLSIDGDVFSNSVNISSSGTLAATTIYIRLASTTPVGNYSGNIVLTSSGTSSVNVPMPNSIVNPALLTIAADNKTRYYETDNPVLTATYSGFVNNESLAQLKTLPLITTTATITSKPAEYVISVSGAAADNYTFNYVAGVLTVLMELQPIVVPNVFTPNNDGVNDKWDIQNINAYPNSTVSVFNRWGQRVYFSSRYPFAWNGQSNGADLPAGTYYYIIDKGNGDKVRAGYVVILR